MAYVQYTEPTVGGQLKYTIDNDLWRERDYISRARLVFSIPDTC
jgi:hypothetical protein